MWFVLLGLLLIVLNLLNIGFFGTWEWPGDWWKMCWPFGLAMAWWYYADASGLTKRREIEKMEAKKHARRTKNLVSLGMDHKGRRGKKR
jgi:small Trp-rich protein